MLRKVLIALAVLVVLFLVVPGAAFTVHAQGTTSGPTAQDVLNAISPILIGLVFGLVTGTVVGAPIIALFILRGILNSPAVLQFLTHLADSLSPEWKQVLQASGTLLDDISGSAAQTQQRLMSKQPQQFVPPTGDSFTTSSTNIPLSPPASIQAGLAQ